MQVPHLILTIQQADLLQTPRRDLWENDSGRPLTCPARRSAGVPPPASSLLCWPIAARAIFSMNQGHIRPPRIVESRSRRSHPPGAILQRYLVFFVFILFSIRLLVGLVGPKAPGGVSDMPMPPRYCVLRSRLYGLVISPLAEFEGRAQRTPPAQLNSHFDTALGHCVRTYTDPILKQRLR